MIHVSTEHSTVFYRDEKPCIGLPPDTDPCPICGAPLSEECRAVYEQHERRTGDDK